ncbi:9135_t:CDS:2 [Entrophospora sp. SA101]|nr:9135_t:CDS:2 [Entrophospora sp. SA101]
MPKKKATHNSTKSWNKVLELFRADVGYSRKIEEIDDKNILEDQLSKFILAMKKIDRTPYHASSIQNSDGIALQEVPLRGGEHQTLKINNFLKRCDGRIDIQLFKSKTNRRSLDNPEAQAKTLANFYLKPCQVDNILFNAQWYFNQPYAQKKIENLFHSICEDAGLDLFHQHISNHSGRKTSVQVLKELGLE